MAVGDAFQKSAFQNDAFDVPNPNNFIVGGVDANWSTVGNWSLGHKPTTGEEVTVDVAVASMVINEATAIIASIDMSGAAANFVLSGTGALNCSGNIKYKASSTTTMTHTGTITVSGNCTFTSNGMTLGSAITLDTASVTLTLADALNIAAKTLTISQGTFNTGTNYGVTCGIFTDAASSTAKTLTLGSSAVACSNLTFSGAGALTVTANTAAINFTSTVDVIANFGGATWGGTTTVLMTGGKKLTLNGANTIQNLSISYTADNILSGLTLGANQTVPGTFTFAGAAIVSRPQIISSAPGTQRTITAGTVTITGAVDFQDIVGAGAGSWNLSAIKSGNLGGNSGITFRTPTSYYLDFGTANATMISNCWATSSGGGAGGTGVFPLPQDTIVIDNLSWDDTGNTFTATLSHRVGKIDASALTEANTITLGGAGSTFYYGSLVLTGAGVTVGLAASTTVSVDSRVRNEASENLVINMVSGSIGAGDITILSYGGTAQLASALTHTGTFTLTQGTLDLNGKVLTTNVFSSSNTNTRVLDRGAVGGKIVVNGLTGTIFNMTTATGLTVSNAPDIDIGDSNNTQTAAVTFAGGGMTFGDFKVTKHAGNFTCNITGGPHFGIFTQETPDVTYQYAGVKFTAATTTYVDGIVADGTSSYQITRESITAATHTISDAGGINTVTYNTITNEIATGGATFNSLLTAGNVDGGGNTGWDFSGSTSATVTPSGVSSTGAVGTQIESGTALREQTGEFLTITAGIPIISGMALIEATGISGIPAIGTVTIESDILIIATGELLTASLGSLIITGMALVESPSVSVTSSIGASDISGTARIEQTGAGMVSAIGTSAVSGAALLELAGLTIISSIGISDISGTALVEGSGVSAAGTVTSAEAMASFAIEATGITGTFSMTSADILGTAEAVLSAVTGTGAIGNVIITVTGVITSFATIKHKRRKRTKIVQSFNQIVRAPSLMAKANCGRVIPKGSLGVEPSVITSAIGNSMISGTGAANVIDLGTYRAWLGIPQVKIKEYDNAEELAFILAIMDEEVNSNYAYTQN